MSIKDIAICEIQTTTTNHNTRIGVTTDQIIIESTDFTPEKQRIEHSIYNRMHVAELDLKNAAS